MQQRKLVLFIATTLDGYIATDDHDLQWLFDVEGEGDNGIAAFYRTTDTILMGRTTYAWLTQHAQTFPYKDRACYVFSRSMCGSTEDVTFVNRDIASFTKALKAQAGKDIWLMGGGELIAQFLREKLVDEIIVTIAPVLLGSGVALFRPVKSMTPLRLKGIQRFNQFVELRYDVLPA